MVYAFYLRILFYAALPHSRTGYFARGLLVQTSLMLPEQVGPIKTISQSSVQIACHIDRQLYWISISPRRPFILTHYCHIDRQLYWISISLRRPFILTHYISSSASSLLCLSFSSSQLFTFL
jgi:hypothetical protein